MLEVAGSSILKVNTVLSKKNIANSHHAVLDSSVISFSNEMNFGKNSKLWEAVTNKVVQMTADMATGDAVKLPHSTALLLLTFDCLRRQPFLWWRWFIFWRHLGYYKGRGREFAVLRSKWRVKR